MSGKQKQGFITAYFTKRYIPRCKLTLNYSLYKVVYLTGICLVGLIVKFVLMVLTVVAVSFNGGICHLETQPFYLL